MRSLPLSLLLVVKVVLCRVISPGVVVIVVSMIWLGLLDTTGDSKLTISSADMEEFIPLFAYTYE